MKMIPSLIEQEREPEREREVTPQNKSLDCLHCEELYCGDDDDSTSFEKEEENHFVSLLIKEGKTHISDHNTLESNKVFLVEVRKGILVWMKRVSSYHNFSQPTFVLGVNYFDRFILNVGFKRERPWLTPLVALASLSLASKFEQVHVPPLVELQVDCQYIFEAKTIKRMELLILSTLEWNMNTVTPFSYFGHLIRMFKLKNHRLQWEILTKWETLIFSAVADPRYLHYAPSVTATAAMAQTMEELELWKTTQIHLMETFEVDKDKLEECYNFIQEISCSEKTNKIRCYTQGDSSPTRVLDTDLSETSQDSSLSSGLSPDELVPKKCRTSMSLS